MNTHALLAWAVISAGACIGSFITTGILTTLGWL